MAGKRTPFTDATSYRNSAFELVQYFLDDAQTKSGSGSRIGFGVSGSEKFGKQVRKDSTLSNYQNTILTSNESKFLSKKKVFHKLKF